MWAAPRGTSSAPDFSLAVPILRRTRPDLERGFRTPLSPVLPVVSAVLCVALTANLAIDTRLRFVVWLALGFVVHFVYGVRHSRVQQRRTPRLGPDERMRSAGPGNRRSMKAKLSFIAGLGAGYVLGARAGRERYDQIAEKAQGVWHDPRVQEKAQQAQNLAKEKAGQAAEIAQDKAGDLAAGAQQAVKDKVSSSDETGIGWPDNADSATTPGTATGPGTGTSGGTQS